MSVVVNSIIGTQSGSIDRDVRGSEFGEESGSLESRAVRNAGLTFGSIAFEIVAPEVTSNRSSSIGAIGSELGDGTGACAASRTLSGGRARSCPSR